MHGANLREGGEGIPDQCDQSQMIVARKAFDLFRKIEPITIHKRKVDTMLNAIYRFVKEEEGASAAEYALLLVVITLGIVGAVTLLGANITAAITGAAATLVGS